MFSYAAYERLAVNDYKYCFENSKAYEENIEYMEYALSKKIQTNVNEIKNKKDVKAYLQSLSNDFRIYHGSSYLTYCRENDRIKITSYLANGEAYENRFEYNFYGKWLSFALIK